MNRHELRSVFFVFTMCLVFGSVAFSAHAKPKPFANQIEAFEKKDRESFPPTGGIVAIGSSSMRGWNSKIQDDLAPLTIIPRGFGGSSMYTANMYMDRIVLPYKPRAILLYEGDNDMASKNVTPELFMERFQTFKQRVFEQNPQCRIYVISIKPSIKRWGIWEKMKKANSLMAADCAADERLTYLDVSKVMLNDAGEPREEIFKSDKLHMTRDGYLAWRDLIKPVLMEKELQFEKTEASAE